jgi:hypothetical protein
MSKLDYAHLIRFLDDRTPGREEALSGARWHIRNSITLRRQPAVRADRSGSRSPWVMRNTPIVAVGTHDYGRDLVLFGNCTGTRWAPFDDPGDPERRYKAQLAIKWEPVIFTVSVDEQPGYIRHVRGNKGLSEAEYRAWRSAAVELEPVS